MFSRRLLYLGVTLLLGDDFEVAAMDPILEEPTIIL